jgi:hypothetical protein
MNSAEEAKEIVAHLDRLSELLASTEKMTIYHGFKSGAPMPFDEAKRQLSHIDEAGIQIKEKITSFEAQGDYENIINLCVTYINRILENSRFLGEITNKLMESSSGGKKYGFFMFRKDSKEWGRSTKKLLNVHSNVHLFLRNINA